MLYNSKVYYYNVIFHNTNTAYVSDMVIYLKPMSHQSGVLTAFPQRLIKCRSPRYYMHNIKALCDVFLRITFIQFGQVGKKNMFKQMFDAR